MKRDMELIRDLLLAVENRYDGFEPVRFEEDYFGSYTKLEVQHHLKLLFEAGLINVIDVSDKLGPEFMVKGLTWEGHDFLDASRSDKVWEKAKEEARNQGSQLSELPLAVIKGLLISSAKQTFGIE